MTGVDIDGVPVEVWAKQQAIDAAMAKHTHDWANARTVEEDYGSLADGGSYERLECECGESRWFPLPD